jgi:O-antigen/teichoic acid export membrane protein
MYRDSAALGVAAVINVIYFRVDAVMVASIRGVDAAAGYAVAYRFLDMVLILPATFGATVLPALVRRGDDPEVLHRWANACIRLTLGFMVPVILVGILFAGPVMAVLGGRGFASSADVLRLLLIAGLFSSVDIMLGLLIVAAGLQGRMLWLNISALAANVIGNVILIPRFGGAGAAAMTGICEAAVMIVAVVVLRRTTGFAVRLRFDRREIAHVKVVLS